MIEGKAWKFGDDVNTDEIVPARYLNMHTPEELAEHCMEDADPDFVKKISPGDVIVAGKNFGCGSSREHAPVAIKASKIAAVVAPSFARIFFRNAINMGLPIIESPQAAAEAAEGDVLRIDLEKGVLTNVTKKKTYPIAPLPPELRQIIETGGLIAYAQALVGKKDQ